MFQKNIRKKNIITNLLNSKNMKCAPRQTCDHFRRNGKPCRRQRASPAQVVISGGMHHLFLTPDAKLP